MVTTISLKNFLIIGSITASTLIGGLLIGVGIEKKKNRLMKESHKLADKNGSHYLDDEELYSLGKGLGVIKNGEVFISRNNLTDLISSEANSKDYKNYLETH